MAENGQNKRFFPSLNSDSGACGQFHTQRQVFFVCFFCGQIQLAYMYIFCLSKNKNKAPGLEGWEACLGGGWVGVEGVMRVKGRTIMFYLAKLNHWSSLASTGPCREERILCLVVSAFPLLYSTLYFSLFLRIFDRVLGLSLNWSARVALRVCLWLST